MRWHVVGTFGVMLEIVGVLRHQSIEKFFEIAPRRWIGVLHYDQATTGMLRENCDNAVFNFALAHKRFDFVGDFVSAFSRCRDGEVFCFYTHRRAQYDDARGSGKLLFVVPSEVEESLIRSRRESEMPRLRST